MTSVSLSVSSFAPGEVRCHAVGTTAAPGRGPHDREPGPPINSLCERPLSPLSSPCPSFRRHCSRGHPPAPARCPEVSPGSPSKTPVLCPWHLCSSDRVACVTTAHRHLLPCSPSWTCRRLYFPVTVSQARSSDWFWPRHASLSKSHWHLCSKRSVPVGGAAGAIGVAWVAKGSPVLSSRTGTLCD